VIGWRITDGWSMGARPFVQYVDAYDESELGEASGDGTSPGVQVGVNYRAPTYVFGASYTSRTNTELKARSIRFDETDSMPTKVDLRGPDRLQVGYARRLGDDIWWEFDLDWIGWSYVEELPIQRADGSVLNAGRTARNYRDTLSYRTGLRWQWDERRLLYFGVGYDPSPVPKNQASASINNLRMTRAAVGTSFQLSRSLKLDAAYQYVRGHSRRISETEQDDFGGIDTSLFEGTYRSESHVLGFTLTGSF
jgi:long-subunit fatty acid transport protein